MKVVSSIQGTAAVKYSTDEALPETAVLTRDLMAFLGDAYNFSQKPQVPSGLIPPDTFFIFQSGALIIEDKKTPINQLVLGPGAIAVTARNTEIATNILDHIIGKMDAQFGYKIATSVRAKYYSSNIVIEFDPALENQIAALDRAQKVLEREIPRPGYPFAIKRLAFGAEPKPGQMISTSVDDLQNLDFVIERRAGESFSTNRYFSTAPLKTSEHERVLRLVEEAMRG
ncbi:MAG: hypothetical protein ACHQRJ_20275 [Alphaproteobacteria bacterium]